MSLAPFDPSLAASTTARLPLARVVDPLAGCPHDQRRIDWYRRAMRDGARFPPIAVVRWGRRYLVADGHKRLEAYRGLAPAERGAALVVEVWTWRRWLRDQLRQAGDNARKNGRIVRLSLTDPKEARREIATTVAHWRRVGRSLVKSYGRGAGPA